MKPWFLKTQVRLTWRQLLALACGARLAIAFHSPDGNCHAACRLEWQTTREPL